MEIENSLINCPRFNKLEKIASSDSVRKSQTYTFLRGPINNSPAVKLVGEYYGKARRDFPEIVFLLFHLIFCLDSVTFL